MDINKFKKLPIMGILRGLEAEVVGGLVEAVVSAGLKTLEITMNTPAAADLIKQMTKAAGAVVDRVDCARDKTEEHKAGDRAPEVGGVEQLHVKDEGCEDDRVLRPLMRTHGLEEASKLSHFIVSLDDGWLGQAQGNHSLFSRIDNFRRIAILRVLRTGRH